MQKRFILLLIVSLLLTCRGAFAQGRFVVGVLPVDNESTESLTEFLPTGLTMLLYNHMRDMANVEPILLGPGALYDPESRDWIQEYGKKSHVDVMLISRLLNTIKVNDRKRRLVFEIELMDVNSGTITPKLVNDAVEVQTSDLFTTMGTSYISSNASAGLFLSFLRSPSDWEKQRLGMAAVKLVDWTKASLETSLPTLGATPTGTASDGVTAPCPMTFRVRFMTRHSIAKGYTLLANDTDQSTAVNDGIATFSVPNGPLVIRVTIPEPPYGIPTQKLYQTSTIHSCSAPEHDLTMEIGSAGEAQLRWE